MVGSALFLMALVFPGQAAASFTVGELSQHCRSFLKLQKRKSSKRLTRQQVIDVVKCSSFVAGIHFGKIATNVRNDTHGPYCLPNGGKVTTKWIVKVFIDWSRRHPREKASPAAVGIMKSLMERYGCDERDRVK
ncbi:MAG: hypothetical protein L3J67_05290 [Hyphomicrobiaceae bacterium]|nr:hypothetical protein [Hyphomicrobiaceae bacterium]